MSYYKINIEDLEDLIEKTNDLHQSLYDFSDEIKTALDGLNDDVYSGVDADILGSVWSRSSGTEIPTIEDVIRVVTNSLDRCLLETKSNKQLATNLINKFKGYEQACYSVDSMSGDLLCNIPLIDAIKESCKQIVSSKDDIIYSLKGVYDKMHSLTIDYSGISNSLEKFYMTVISLGVFELHQEDLSLYATKVVEADDSAYGIFMILSIMVGTFSSKMFVPMLHPLKHHSIAYA